MKKNLLDYDLQLFADDVEGAEVSEAAEPTTEETSEGDSTETGETEESGNAEPQEQSAEDNARYAAIRRRAEQDARRRIESEYGALDQQIASMCKDVKHPLTGKPITNIREYVDALSAQQKMQRDQELKDKGIDPSLIDRMIEESPAMVQARQVIEKSVNAEADAALQRDLAEITKYDPSIKGIDDLASLPNFPEMLEKVARGASIVDAYKMCNFDAFMQHTNESARQQAINQMRGKSHLPSQTTGVAADSDDVEVPADIMARWKEDGKTEKQIRELYKKVAGKLHLT